MTDVALELLLPHLPNDVERIEVECEELSLTALNVLHRVPALRIPESKVSFYSGGVDSIRQIKDGVFDASVIGEAGMFTISQMNRVFYTEELFDLIRRNSLAGIHAKPIGKAV